MKRIINFANGIEVRCPYHLEDIDVIGGKGCLLRMDERCQFLEKIDVGTVDCTWTEQDGHGETGG